MSVLLTKNDWRNISIMDEKLLEWQSEYFLENLKTVGYQGGYPIIEFKRNSYSFETLPKKKIDKILRRAEMVAGMELGVGINFRKTAFLLINTETIVIWGHVLVIDKIVEYIMLQK